MVNPAETPVETSTAAAASKDWTPKDSLVLKVEKCVDSYRAKIQKLQEENQRLRASLSEVRNSNSRVRRIPKKKAAEQTAEATA